MAAAAVAVVAVVVSGVRALVAHPEWACAVAEYPVCPCVRSR